MGARRIPILVLGALLALPSAPSARAQEAAAPAVDLTLLPYASTREAVRLSDGRTIHLVCMGQGAPVVILTTGANGWSVGWNTIQPAIAAHTRACAWDRAGYGLSTGVPKPQTVDESTTDLQAALEGGRISGPYVVVGVSLGGLESMLLADREPSDVVGMVLVDPSFPDQNNRQRRAAPALMEWDLSHPPPFFPILKKCAAALRAGTVRHGGPDPDRCMQPPWPPNYPPELRAALDKTIAEATPQALASALEGSPMELNSKVAVKTDRNYGNMPLIVLTAGVVQGSPDIPADLKAEVPLVQAEWRRAHEEIAALSTRGVDRIVPGSSHDISHNKPQVVIDAILEVVDEARGSMHSAAGR
jgi:pimeloyl-ACP methyl ester carboxylesterase